MGGVPPPPGGIPGAPMGIALPPLPTKKPSSQLKAFHWKKLPNMKVAQTVWIQKKLAEKTKDVAMDTESLETLFAAKKKASAGDDDSSKAAKVAKPTVVTLLDPKRAQNVAILLGSTFKKVSFPDIRKWILNMDESHLTAQHVISLSQVVPQPDEIETLQSYSEDISKLGSSEQFFLELMQIPRLETRLSSWIFKRKFDTQLQELRPNIDALIDAAKEMRESERFMKFLQVVLAIGNFVNGGSFRANAYGFQLNCLTKLQETKSLDGKTTLLDYVVEHCLRKSPEILEFPSDMAHVEDAIRVSITNLQQETAQVQKGMKMVQVELKQSAYDTEGDSFKEVMEAFERRGSEDLDAMMDRFKTMEETMEKLAMYFGEDPAKFSPEEFFGEIGKFMTMLAASKKKVAIEMEKKRLEKPKTATPAKESASSKGISERKDGGKKGKEGGTGEGAEGGEKEKEGRGLLNDLFSSIADGTAFRKRRQQQQQKMPQVDLMSLKSARTGLKSVKKS
eukprot:TRINITY_DN1027_c2_g1_i3.p1 TRINITY_DN1027_c2_g1~~TRINITY_DN1027_c2_g1_i3.p1  ORF type:complete len:548 (+),score=205.67 TRINITY_DN1027_c2_g1_i3:124-1644(+)